MANYANKITQGKDSFDLIDRRIENADFQGEADSYVLSVEDGKLKWVPQLPNQLSELCRDQLTEIVITQPLSRIRRGPLTNSKKLKRISLGVINGPVETKAFTGLENLEHFSFSPESNITNLGPSSFMGIGYNRENLEDRFYFDFRNSTFRYGGVFSRVKVSWREEEAIGLINTELRMPESLVSLESYVEGSSYSISDYQSAFLASSENIDVYFTGPAVPRLSYLTWLPTDSLSHIFVPFKYAYSYRSATNWSALDNLYVYAEFEEGASLPRYNPEGYQVTWYKDKDCTEELSDFAPGGEIYAVIGYTRLAFPINLKGYHSTVDVVHDGEPLFNKDLVEPGWILTLTPRSTDPNKRVIKYFYYTGKDYYAPLSEDPVTVTVPSGRDEFTIRISYNTSADSPIVYPDFNSNSYAVIAEVFDEECPDCWELGDFFYISYSPYYHHNDRYIFTLVHKSPSYDFVYGGGRANHVLMQTLYPRQQSDDAREGVAYTTMVPYHDYTEGYTGWGKMPGRTALINNAQSKFPDLFEYMAPVKVPYDDGIDEEDAEEKGVQYSEDKLFVPAVKEIFGENDRECLFLNDYLEQFDYYKEGHVTAQIPNLGSIPDLRYSETWLRTHQKVDFIGFNTISSGGTPSVRAADPDVAYVSASFCPCFVLSKKHQPDGE